MPIPFRPPRHILAPSIGSATLLAGCMLWAQANPPLTSKWTPGAIPIGGGIVIAVLPAVTGEPFTADNNSRQVMLINGEKITYESHSIVARDSLGRIATRTAASPHVPLADGSGEGFLPGGGSIRDPAARMELSWVAGATPQADNIVLKNHIPAPPPQSGPSTLTVCERESGKTPRLLKGVTKRIEDLGEKTIQGIDAQGCRVTTLIPAGASLNDRPFTITDETWVSPELRITLLHVFHDSNGEDRIEQLDHITPGEPDPSLFEPPADYHLHDLDAQREKEEEQTQFTVQPGQPEAEMLAGNWETDDPFSSPPARMGILLTLAANRRVPLRENGITGNGPQRFQDFEIDVYLRAGGEEKRGFFDTRDGQNATWDGSRLTVAFKGDSPTAFVQGNLRLDLSFDKQMGLWTGSYTRGSVTKQVRLTRPGASKKPQSNPFLGGWSESDKWPHGNPPPDLKCVHIAKGSDGALVAWRDTKDAGTINPLEGYDVLSIGESDGDALGVTIDRGALTLQEGIHWAGLAGQLPVKFTGKLSPDGTQIIGSWVTHIPESWGEPAAPQEEKPSEPALTSTFTKIPTGQSCWSQPQGF